MQVSSSLVVVQIQVQVLTCPRADCGLLIGFRGQESADQ